MCASENIDARFLPFATWHRFRSAHGHVDDAFAHRAWLQLDRPAFRRGDWNTAGVGAQGKWRRADILGQHSFWLGDFRLMCFRRPGDDFSGDLSLETECSIVLSAKAAISVLSLSNVIVLPLTIVSLILPGTAGEGSDRVCSMSRGFAGRTDGAGELSIVSSVEALRLNSVCSDGLLEGMRPTLT